MRKEVIIVKLVIAGFNDYEKLDRTMQKLIEDSQFFLFTVVCGGTGIETDKTGARIKTIGEQWAEKNGAPMEFLYRRDAEDLLDKIAKEADYIVADLSCDNQWIKRLVMRMRSMSKHGTVIK